MHPGRKPAHLRGAGRQAIWDAIRELELFSVPDLERASRQDAGTIYTYLACLEKAGYIEQVDVQGGPPIVGGVPIKQWRLVRDVGHEAPQLNRDGQPSQEGRSRQAMWTAIRVAFKRSEFSHRDLAIHASTDEHKVAEQAARTYVLALARAGYLHRTSPPRNGQLARYRFMPTKDTGPKAPQVQRIRQVYDQNLRKVVWSETGGVSQ